MKRELEPSRFICCCCWGSLSLLLGSWTNDDNVDLEWVQAINNLQLINVMKWIEARDEQSVKNRRIGLLDYLS